MRILTFIAILFALTLHAQENPGYYITNGGEKIEGYFKQTNFFDSSSLKFKKTAEEEYSALSDKNIKEYGINGQFKFKKFTVDVDKSDANFDKLSMNKNPEWTTETIFLDILVEGPATLYSYHGSHGLKLFYSLNKETPQQLIYKKYSPQTMVILINNAFRQQLYANFSCGHLAPDYFDKVDYSEKSVENVFKDYNACRGAASVVYENKGSKSVKINFSVFAATSLTSFEMSGPDTNGKDSNICFSGGFEAAMVVPSGKFEIFLRGELEQLKGDASDVKTNVYNQITSIYSVNTTVINVYLGPRYNFIINDSQKIFLDASLELSLPSGKILYETQTQTNNGTEYTTNEQDDFKLANSVCCNFGVGYVLNNKYGIGLQYETNRNMLSENYGDYKTKISRLQLALRYTF